MIFFPVKIMFMSRTFLVFIITAMLSLVARTGCLAQTDAIERLWYNEEKTSKIQVYKAVDGKFYGKIAWLKVTEENGKPRTDSKNPNDALKNTPLLGLLILKGFKKDGDDQYTGGTIYDPKNGKTYSCKITRNGDKLNVRGYIGFSLIGRTTTWTKAE
jgi:uncharacterized protein (DUF2147 family)